MSFKAISTPGLTDAVQTIGRDGNRPGISGLAFDARIGPWQCDASGVSLNGKSACGTPVLLTARILCIDDPTAPEKVLLSFQEGDRWCSLPILRSQYSDPSLLVKLTDRGLSSNRRMAGLLSDYLTDFYTLNRDRLPVIRSVTRLGWMNLESEPVFSPYLEQLYPDCDPEFEPLFRAVHSAGSYSAWVQTARRFRAESTPAKVMLAASFASVLVKPLGALPFFCHLWGPTACGKTVALQAAASIWADPNHNYIKNFNSTTVGFERTAHFLNSLPYCIDELQLARKEKGKVVFNPYELAEGQGRTRGTRNGGIEAATNWAFAVLTTGESPLNPEGAGAGARNRVVEIGWNNKVPLLQDGGEYAEQFACHYGQAGPEFILRMTQPGVMDEMKQFNRRMTNALRRLGVSDKQAGAGALLLTADFYASAWLFEAQSWEDPQQVQTVPPLSIEELLPYLATNEQVMVGPRAYDYLCGWVTRERSRFDPSNQIGPTYGVVEDGWAYIIASEFNAACRAADFDPDAVRAELKNMGKLRAATKSCTVQKRVRGTRVRCVCLQLEEDAFVELPAEEDDPFCHDRAC